MGNLTEAKKEALAIRVAEIINSDEKKEGANVVILREGAAEVIKYPNAVRLAGVISAPREFFEKRIKTKALFGVDDCHVLYDVNEGTIKFIVNERFEKENHSVIGKLTKNPDLEAFGINDSDTVRDVKEMMEFLKMNRIFFTKKEDHKKFIVQLQNFKMKVTAEIENISDLRGNDKISKTQKLEAEIETSFEIALPIYKGQPDRTFNVDVYCHINDGALEIYLQSPDLKEIEMGMAKSIIEKELEQFNEAGIVCIEE